MARMKSDVVPSHSSFFMQCKLIFRKDSADQKNWKKLMTKRGEEEELKVEVWVKGKVILMYQIKSHHRIR